MKRLVVFLALAIFPASAYAQSPEAGAGDELGAEIDRDWAQAQSSDCDIACRALDSMHRATDRLCAMDPGDRCARARKKLADATTRVQSACPSCAEAAGQTSSDATKAEEAPAPAPPPANAAAEETVQKKNGGCGGCTLGGHSSGGAAGRAGWLLALALAMRRLRTRSRQRRTP